MRRPSQIEKVLTEAIRGKIAFPRLCGIVERREKFQSMLIEARTTVECFLLHYDRSSAHRFEIGSQHVEANG